MAEIKKINVDGVDYDIVSEPAERKIAALEKTNVALHAVTFGTRDTQTDFIHVGFGITPPEYSAVKDVFIGKGAYIGENVHMGTEFPIRMRWDDRGNFRIESDGGNRGAITIGSNVNIQVGSGSGSGNAGIEGKVQIDSGSELHMSSSTINMYDSHLTLNAKGLHFGTENGHIGNNVGIVMYGDAIELQHGFRHICRFSADACDIYIGSKTDDDKKGLIINEGGAHILEIGNDVYIGNSINIGSCVNIGESVHIGAHVAIGGNLSSEEHLNIQGPVFLEAKNGEPTLTIGTDLMGCLKIDWGENDKIVFTNLNSGKKATLTLS